MKGTRQTRWFSGKRFRNAAVVVLLLLLSGFAEIASGQQRLQYSVLYTFTGVADGATPSAGLAADEAGNLYGSTYLGGNVTQCVQPFVGCGVVFKLDPAGTETVLYTFNGGRDGAYPNSILRDSAGNLYGMTSAGGRFTGPCNTSPFGYHGCGVVFKVDPAGNQTVLHAFTGGPDGEAPLASLVRDSAGNLYGTTAYGGAYGFGVVFKLDASGKETVLHSFTGGTDGANPYAGLIRDAAGNLYGATPWGGDAACDFGVGCGTVFKMDPLGNETVLYKFEWGADGAFPSRTLTRDPDGNLYGIADGGGATFGGVVFKVDPGGNETVLHNFTGGKDGSTGLGLIRDHAGNLYISAGGGGRFDRGLAFVLTAAGTEHALYNFSGGSDGGGPEILFSHANGLYGTAISGGDAACQCGVVFKISH